MAWLYSVHRRVARNQLVSNNGIHAGYNKIENKEEKLITWFNDIKKVLENTKTTCLDWKRLFNEHSHWQDNSGTRSIGIFLTLRTLMSDVVDFIAKTVMKYTKRLTTFVLNMVAKKLIT